MIFHQRSVGVFGCALALALLFSDVTILGQGTADSSVALGAKASPAITANDEALADSRIIAVVSPTVARYFDPLQGSSSIDLVRRALASNGELAAARLDIERARARVRQAGLRPNSCDDLGKFWNFTSGVCQNDPPTQIICEGVTAFWNFTNSTCGSSPAIGNCGGGADWGNYFSTGCWTSLGLFGGSFCDRSTTFKNKCYQYDGDYDSNYCVCTGCGSCGGSPILIDVPGGFDMTDVAHGVRFDLNSIGGADRVSWTSRTSTAAWLVLDRNRDGI